MFSAEHRQIIDRANTIIADYAAQGYDLTLRQLYYQFVSRNWITNNDKSYKRLGNVLSDARRAGEIDWDAIVDRTRHVRVPPAWKNPAELVATCATAFDVDWWARQPYRPLVMIEKDALVGVLEVACAEWHCPYFSCRGYTSDSELWSAARKFDDHIRRGQTPVIFHLGDHDPSGLDMTRDIADRIALFMSSPSKVKVRRLALNMDQIEQYNPPPNPAKVTDARFASYQAEYGDESWELDALSPAVISELIGGEMRELIDETTWSASQAARDEGRRKLQAVSDRWRQLTEDL